MLNDRVQQIFKFDLLTREDAGKDYKLTNYIFNTY